MDENGVLTDENKSLKQTVSELQSIQTTVVDMEQKLRDLQSKLRGEEATKHDLSQQLAEVRMMSSTSAADVDVREVKSMQSVASVFDVSLCVIQCDPCLLFTSRSVRHQLISIFADYVLLLLQASSRTDAMKQELDRTGQQLQDMSEGANALSELKKQVEELEQQLEKEKKSVKEVQSQNVKLRSLVKIGEDSLRAEMQRTDELLNQLKLKNGSAVSTPCLTTNGSSHDQDSVVSSISSSSLNPEDKS